MASYERYFNHLIKQAQQNTAAYGSQRRRQAETDAQEIQKEYRAAEQAATAQSRLSLAQTEADYRKTYYANAVSEAVARRNAAEALANSQLTNSGLNATQQTAVSLARSRADSDTTLQKQAAVQTIMRELDAVRAGYRKQAAEETSAIYKQAQADMREYEAEQTQAAQSQAQAMYEADLKAAEQAAAMSRLEMEAALSAKEAQQEAQRKAEEQASKIALMEREAALEEEGVRNEWELAASKQAAQIAQMEREAALEAEGTRNEWELAASKQAAEIAQMEREAALDAELAKIKAGIAASEEPSDKNGSSDSENKAADNSDKDAQTETAGTSGSVRGARENPMSKTAVEINAATKREQDGNLQAWAFLRKCVGEGWITAEEQQSIMARNNIREPQTATPEYVNGMVMLMLQSGNQADARVFLDTLIENGLVDPVLIPEVIRKVYGRTT